MNKIKDILDREMTERGLSANKLSELTGIPQPTITRIRNGKTSDPETATVKALADYFGLSVAQMRGEVDFKYIQFETMLHKVEEPKAKFEVSQKPNTDLIDQLSPKSKQIVLDLINQLIELEKANTWF